MPRRKRAQEHKRQKRTPDVPGWQIEVVGPIVQAEDTWRERECDTCGSPQCRDH